MLSQVRLRLERREEELSPFAARSAGSRGRAFPEDPSPLRTEFQRDRDRIIHSNGFRRLKRKTQVFIAPTGDHYVTRLTHTLEVTQIARTIARALNLNEDLAEAIGLGHDLGHTPFGHLGEEELNHLYPGGFHHSAQSLRLVECLGRNGQGLNLTWEVREGIESHSKPREDLMGALKGDDVSLEAQVCRISDAVAYLNHDIGDAIRAGVISEDDLPQVCKEVLGGRHSQRIDTMVSDIVTSSWNIAEGKPQGDGERPSVSMSPRARQAANELREFMFQRVYLPASDGELGRQAREIIRMLYRHFCAHPEEIPSEYHVRQDPAERMAVDYVSSMTDQFALRIAEGIRPGVASLSAALYR